MMTDEEILDSWYKAIKDHGESAGSRYGDTLFKKLSAEARAIERFGLGAHKQALESKFPSSE